MKLKTKKAIAKRFKLTKRGKIKRRKAYKSHLLSKKPRSRKRRLRRTGLVSGKRERRMISKMLPYG